MIAPQSVLNRRYRVGRTLGEGGMAVVYLGHDLELGRAVAIKTLRPELASTGNVRTRFAREARAAAALSHQNIIDVFDVGEADGTPYLVMEWVRGQTLKDIITSDAPFHPDDVAELMFQVGAALDYAHHRGYVHRDIKPGNILIDQYGRARVADFGIAKSLADADLTDAGGGFGTVGYLAPEQVDGLMATPATDIYAAGVVAFEMLTGQLPFTAETPVGVAMQHLHEPAPRPSTLAPSIPSAIDEIVLKALEKDPTRRWSSAGSFASALRSWQDGSVSKSERVDPPLSEGRNTDRNLTAAAVFLVVAALAGLLWFGIRNSPVPSPSPTPVVPAPIEPIITGGLDASSDLVPNPVEATDPVAGTDAGPDFVPAESPPAPTIAPATQGIVAVPNLQGLSISGSSSALLPLGLRIAQDQPTYSASVPLNAVVSQDPPPGSAVPPGTIVRVSLSRGPSPFGSDGPP